jgi:hypothetical protein
MHIPGWTYLLILASEVPTVSGTLAKNCPGCVDYSNNLLACENEWPLEWKDYKDIHSQFPGTNSLGCVCIGQLEGFSGATTGLQQMLSCWKCLPGNSEANPLLYKWIVTCETYFNEDYGPAKALKCWNTDMEKGCWLG